MDARVAARSSQPINPADSPHQRALDEWQRQLWRACGLAIGRWLDERGYLQKPISSLRIEELEGMAWACVAQYQEIREQKRKELMLQQHLDPLKQDQLDLTSDI